MKSTTLGFSRLNFCQCLIHALVAFPPAVTLRLVDAVRGVHLDVRRTDARFEAFLEDLRGDLRGDLREDLREDLVGAIVYFLIARKKINI